MKSTIRECDNCEYRTMILQDALRDRTCKHYGGLMKIIAQEKKA